MRVSLEWLTQFVTVTVAPDVLAERLQSVGLGVESVERLGEDTVLEIELTANRPDCMSHLGIGRETALLLDQRLRYPEGYQDPEGALRRLLPAPQGKDRPSRPRTGRDQQLVVIEDAQGCPRFTASVITGVRVGPSPAWMQRRLEASGVRAINNVVDVTNYVMLEIGQPMHAFDYERLEGHRLIVRRATRGETLQTLDGMARRLNEEVLVVADGQRATALAGIIGGSATEISPGTTTVLLEAAYWDPPTIGRTARRLGIRTEASARFERGSDPDGPPRAQARALGLLVELCGGRVLGDPVDVYPRPRKPRTIRLRPDRATAVLGVDVPRKEMIRILRALGCTVAGTTVLTVTAPTFRPDLEREEDLIEEIIRIYGYDRVPSTLPRGTTTAGVTFPLLRTDERVRDTLTRCGLTEVLTLTLVSEEIAASGGSAPVRLQNPLSGDQAALRTSLLPGLLDVLATNASRRVEDVQVFELGRVFRDRGPGERPEERRALGVAVMGKWRRGWNIPAEQAEVDFFHLKGIIETLLQNLGIPDTDVTPSSSPDPWWHPGRAAEVRHAERIVGRFGELHPDRSAARDLPHRAYVAEVDLEALLPRVVSVGIFAGLPRYPAVERDLAVVVPRDLPAVHVQAVIGEVAGPLLEAVELFDVYTGPPVPPDHRNLAYRLRLRAPDRTLTAEEAEEIMQRVRIALQERVGAHLRV
jgi:phenylalanyl-tRNA synthetase beta chain